MKTKLKYLIPLLLLAACTSNRKADEKPAPLFPQPQSVAANPQEGYTLNPVSADTIQPLVNSLGDTVKTGVSIPAKGKTIHPDSVAAPKVVPYIPSDSTYNAHPNVHKIPKDLTVIPVNQDSLAKIVFEAIAPDDTTHYLVNSTGDTLKTGAPIPAKGKSVPTTQPQPTPALPPRFKDAAITNLQYLDVAQGMASSYVRSILEDKKGNLWFGTDGGGVSMYDGESFMHFTEKEGLSNNTVWSILEDKNGNLWFGTYGGGVSMYDGESFMHFTEKEGLSNNIVWSILEDKNGNLWLSTDKGISLLEHNKLNENKNNVNRPTFVVFEKNDGLKGMDFYANSVCLDSKNRIWWGSGKSLTMLDMNKYQKTQKPPTVYLRQLDVNEKFIDYRNISDSLGNEIEFNGVQRFENYPLNLELPYDENHLTFHFAAIDWNAPHKIQYSYIMSGLNANWSIPSHEAKADYRNLPYGTYTFKVRAIGESGEWSEPFENEFTIHPPWWHTWWARALYALFALALILGLIKWRTTKLKQRQKELETEVKNATKEIRQQKEEVEHQKEQVEKAHKEITDSINYAERIQRSFLASKETLDTYLGVTSSTDSGGVSRSEPNYFVFFQPKETVSGDFYWADKLSNGDFAIVNADSTGHGVPGAIMSILNISSIEAAVKDKLTNPADIFNDTRKTIINRLKKDGSEHGGKDGMDASLISFNPEKTAMKYVAAQNPIWVIRAGEVIELKPEKMPVGKHDNDHIPFEGGEFDLQKGDQIYTLTDGFQDQFGGPKGKKFMVTKMREYVLSISHLPMQEQHDLISKTFMEWKGGTEQVDDVCVIGVRME